MQMQHLLDRIARVPTSAITQHSISPTLRRRTTIGFPAIDYHLDTFDIREASLELLVVLVSQLARYDIVDHEGPTSHFPACCVIVSRYLSVSKTT